MRALVLNAERVTVCGQMPPMWRHPIASFEDVPEPTVLYDDDILVAPMAIGICGTDVSCLREDAAGFMSFRGPSRLPVILGHEIVGRVVDAGKRAKARVGSVVALESVQACQSCLPCRSGHPNQCERLDLVGLTIDGGFASLVRAKSRHAHSLDALVERFGLSRAIELGTLLEPAGCAYNGLFVDRSGTVASRIDRSSIVAVFGAGPIGLLAIALAKAATPRKLVAFDLFEERLNLARNIGANSGVLLCRDNSIEPRLAFLAATSGQEATLAFEAAGSTEAFQAGVSVLGPRGLLIVAGRSESSATIDLNTVVSKALVIQGVRGHSGYGIFPALIKALAQGTVDFTGIVTARFPFAQALDAIKQAQSGHAGKILVDLQ